MRGRERFVSAVVRAGAGLGCVVTYLPPFSWTMGPGGRPWEALRRRSSRLLGATFDSRAGPRPITYGEYAGRFDGSLAELEYRLSTLGYCRNPLSRLKTRSGVPEDGSWVDRAGPLADRQVHLILFETASGVDVYAHEEVSSVNPLLGPEHFDSVSMSVGRGVEQARDQLTLDTTLAPSDPPAGHWADGPADPPDGHLGAGPTGRQQ